MDGYAVAAAAVVGVDQSALMTQHKLLSALQQNRVDVCLVCSSPQSASPHFGTVSCLACAAFFRRTVALEITFQCKKDHNCPIYYELRMICRACRYEKCLSAGMKRHCVQKRRPNKKIKGEDDSDSNGVLSPPTSVKASQDNESDRPTVPECNGKIYRVKAEPISPANNLSVGRNDLEDESSDDENDRPNGDEVQQPHSSSVDSYAEEDSGNMPSTSYANNVPSVESSVRSTSSLLGLSGMQLLRHFLNEERRAMDRRRMMFTNNPLAALTEAAGTIPWTREELQPHTLRGQVENVKFDHLLGFEYCRNMPGLQYLSSQEKIMLYRLCALGFCVTDMGYLSARLLRKEEECLVFTDGTYSTCGEGDFSAGWDTEDIITHEDKKKLFLEFNQRFFAEIIRPMRECEIDEVEHAALKALCSWKLGYYEYTNNMRTLAKELETTIFAGLNEYYQDRPDKAIRMGSIVLLMSNLFEMYNIITEMFKQLDFFNLIKVDNISKALLCI